MISIVVVTHNRKFLLEKCLNSLLTQDFDEGYEIIIVDNASCDGTAGFIKEKYNDEVKIVSNLQKEDLASCKEKGANIAKRDIVAFTDDDCIVSRNWLGNVKESLVNYDFVAGIVIPSPDANLPRWWRDSLNWLIGLTSKADNHFLPLGSNIAFRRRVVETLRNAKKKTYIDPNGYLRYGEDNYTVKKVRELGFSLKVNKNMIVYHHVPSERLKMTYLLKRSYIEGWAWATRDPEFKTFFLRIAAFIVNPVRLLISRDINNLFRAVVSAGYICTFIGKKIGRCS